MTCQLENAQPFTSHPAKRLMAGRMNNHLVINPRIFAAAIALILVVGLSGCASPPKPVVKVQTHAQLFLKLKEGFYAGRLMEPDFYAKELGYPLKAPLRFSPEKVSDPDRSQTIALNEGEFQNDSIEVDSVTSIQWGRAVITLFGYGGARCLKEPEFRQIWGAKQLLPRKEPTYHIRLPAGVKNVPGTYWDAEHEIGARKMSAGFEFSGVTQCLHKATFSTREIKG